MENNLAEQNELEVVSLAKLSEGGTYEVPLKWLTPDLSQPRKDFDPEKLESLAASIDRNGLLHAIVVKKVSNDDQGTPLVIIAGERRWRASSMLGLSETRVFVQEKEKAESIYEKFSTQLTENTESESLNAVEEGEFIQEFIDTIKRTGDTAPIKTAAEWAGRSESWVSKKLAILKYAPELRAIVKTGKLRDYSIMKRINQLSDKKRTEAIDLINNGEFNSKEFFKRKRYDQRKPASTDERELDENATSLPEKPKRFTTAMTSNEWIKIISATEFRFVLEAHESNWINASPAIMKSYIEMFRKWVNEN